MQTNKVLTVVILLLLCIVGFLSLFFYIKKYSKSTPLQAKNGADFLYNATNTKLMNGTKGSNYFVGYFEKKQTIDDSIDQIIVLRDINNNELHSFRVVNDVSNPLLTIKALTSMGEENISQINTAVNRDDLISKIDFKNQDISDVFLNNLEQNDVIVATFYACNLENKDICSTDKDKNIFLLGLFKRIK